MQSISTMYHRNPTSAGCHGRKSGFALVAALLVTLILMVVGVMALQMTGQDILMSSAIVADKKATAAAEAGVHLLTLSFQRDTDTYTWTPATVNAQAHPNDATAQYLVSGKPRRPVGDGEGNTTVRMPDFGDMVLYRYIKGQVTGTNTTSGSAATIEVGLGVFGPAPDPEKAYR